MAEALRKYAAGQPGFQVLLRAAGGFWSSFFDYSNKRFRYLACNGCGYTEFYKSSITGLSKFVDFLNG